MTPNRANCQFQPEGSLYQTDSSLTKDDMSNIFKIQVGIGL
jgi:hypothetical protein